MLNCRDIAKQASDHIDKELTFSQSISYGFHLLLCGYCRKFVHHLRTTIDLSQHLPGDAPLTDEEATLIATKAATQDQTKQG